MEKGLLVNDPKEVLGEKRFGDVVGGVAYQKAKRAAERRGGGVEGVYILLKTLGAQKIFADSRV